MYLQDPLIKPRKRWGSELDCQECIFSFFSSCFSHPPGSSVQKLHLFSQARHTFFHRVVVSSCFKDVCQTLPWWTVVSACWKNLYFWKNTDFSTCPHPLHACLLMPSSSHICSGKELGHCVSKFEQINPNGETLTTSKAWFCPVVVYLCCLWAPCGEEVYIIWSERH